jgi:PEP-CTERM motif
MPKFLSAFVGASALALGSVAGAAVTVDSSTLVVDGPQTVADVTVIGFTDSDLASPSFSESLIYTNTLAGLYSITLTTSSPAVDFTSAILAGLGGPYNLVEIEDDGINEFWRLANPITLSPSTYTLTINGNNSGAGSLGGSITIRPSAVPNPQGAIPEPTTWMMMLLGLAAVGFAMRRRQRPTLMQAA